MSKTLHQNNLNNIKHSTKLDKLTPLLTKESLNEYFENVKLKKTINQQIINIDDTNIRGYLNLLDELEILP